MTTAPTQPPVLGDDAPERQHYLVTLALLTTAGISFALMQTLVVPALPFFQREFDTSASLVTWIASGFLLSSSILTPILGKLGDQYGKAKLLVISLTIFGLASLGAAAAWNLGSIVVFRVLQGAGAAVFPLSFGIVRDEFPPEKIGVGIGTISSVFGAGGGIGLVLSGVILEHLNWHWLFLIGAIPVLISAVLIARFVPESPVKTPARADYPGAVTLSLGLLAVLVAVTEGNTWGWTSAPVVVLVVAAVALLAAWVRIEQRVPEPMIDIAMLRRRGMALSNLITFLVAFGMFSGFILLPNFVQIPRGLPDEIAAELGFGFGATPVAVGLFFVPSSIAMVIAGPLAGSLGQRFGPELPLRVGVSLIAFALGLFAVAHDERWMIYVWMTFLGIGIACSFAALGSLVIANSPPAQTGAATGMNTIMRTIGGAFGAQVSAAIITANTFRGTEIPLERGFTIAFAMGAIVAVIALVPALMVRMPAAPRPAPVVSG
jgi:EmrB/QacA subfamily drug resistance transporter